MAGGPTTTVLVAAAARAGALGFLAGGYKTVEALAADMADLRDAGVAVFGVNVFVPGLPAADPQRVAAYVASLGAEASRLGVTPGEPVWDDDFYESKLNMLLAASARTRQLHLRHPRD